MDTPSEPKIDAEELETPSTLLDLPPDVLLVIARFHLPNVADLVHLGLTCRGLASLFFASDLVWRERIAERWGKNALDEKKIASAIASPRKTAGKSSRLPPKSVAVLRSLYSASSDDGDTDAVRPTASSSSGSGHSVPLNFAQHKGSSDGSTAEDLLKESSPHQSIYKVAYAKRHMKDARLESSWAKGSFRTHTVQVLDDYVRRLTPLRCHPRMLLLGTYAGKLHLIGEQSEDIEMTYAGQERETTCLDGDEDLVVGGCAGREIRVWETWSGRTVTVLRGHSKDAIGVKIMDERPADQSLEDYSLTHAEAEQEADEDEVSIPDPLSSFTARMATKKRTRRTKIVYTAAHDGTVLAHRIRLPGSDDQPAPHGTVHDPDNDMSVVYRTSLHGKPTSFFLTPTLLALGTSTGALILLPGDYSVFPPTTDPARLSTTPAHNGPLRSLVIDIKSGILATGGDDCYLRLFTMGPLTPLRAIRAHNHGTVAAIALDGKRGRVATGGTDGAVKVWRIHEEGGWSVFRHTAYLGSVNLLRDRLISDGFNNVVCCHVFE